VNLDQQDIGEIFRDAFDGFEADVQGQPWSGIEQQLQQSGLQASSGGGAASAAGKGIAAKLFSLPVVAIASGLVGAGLIYALNTGNAPDDVQSTNAVVLSEGENTSDEMNATIFPSEALPAEIEEGPVVFERNDEEKRQIEEDNLLAQEVKVIINEEQSSSDERTNPSGAAAQGPMGVNPHYITQVVPVDNGTPSTTAASIDNSSAEEATSSTSTLQEEDVAPYASIMASNIGGYAPLAVTFKSDFEAFTYAWIANGRVIGTEKTLEYTFQNAGVYNVQLEVKNASGATSVNSVKIEVLAPSSIAVVMPNVFTPNNDGQNDVLLPVSFLSNKIKSVTIEVQSRDGKTFFTSDSFNDGWDGTVMNSNDPALEGLYFYIYKAIGEDGSTYKKAFGVTLLR